jgi:chemotaxis protein MotB
MNPKKAQNLNEPPLKRIAEPPHTPHVHDESNWLVSYADMMTLLCGFFIMLFSMAKLEQPKYDAFKTAIAKQFGGESVTASQEMAKYATQMIQEMAIEKNTIVKSESSGVSIAFESTVFFDTSSAELSIQGKKILKGVISKLISQEAANSKKYKIVVEGHTDGRPILSGYYPSNWELSAARATRVLRMFLDHGFNADRVTAIGYADTHPQVNARTPTGHWNEAALVKNRRVVLRILDPTTDSIPYPEDSGS